MRKNFMMRGVSFVTGICLTLSLLFAVSVRAEELKSFLTLKMADPGTLMSVSEKIADLSGQRRDFDAGVASFKDLKGLNKKGPFGLILQSDGEEIKNPVLILPIDKLEDVDLPNFDTLMAGAKKESDGKYVLNSPMGVFNIFQKNGYVSISSVDSEVELPEDVTKLFAGLESYTIALRLDFENTSLDSIEMLMAPMMMLFAMQGGQMADNAANISEAIETLYNECRSLTLGVSFDPNSSAAQIVISTLPKKGTDTERQVLEYKDRKTAFSGFLGAGRDMVFSVGGVDSNTKANQETAMAAVDQFLEGLLQQAEEQAETDEDFETAEKAAESLHKIIEATLKQGKSDFACSLDAEASFLGAMTLGDTEELKKLAKIGFEQFRKIVDAAEVDEAAEKYLKKEYQTVAGYKVSKFVYPFAESKDADIPKALADKTLALFWGVKKDEAVAVAFGFDAEKTEKRFTDALNKTATMVPVKRPEAVFAFQPLGKLLAKGIFEDAKDETLQKVIDLLTATSTNARMTISSNVVDGAMEFRIAATGPAVETLINLIRISAAEAEDPADVPTIRDF